AQLSKGSCRVRPRAAGRAASRRALRGTRISHMRKYGIILLLLVAAGAATAYYFMGDRQANAAGQGSAQDIARERRQQGGGGGGVGGGVFGGGGFPRAPRPPMTVELTPVVRKDMVDT